MANLKYVNESLEQASSFWTIRSGDSRMAAIALGKDNICLVSPLAAVPAEAFNDYTVSHLLAPNHYHNKALSTYTNYFPRAQLSSSKAAKTRLEKITGLTFGTLTTLSKKLPSDMSFITPEGLKTGEIWIKFPVKGGCGWFVTDAVSGKKMSSKNFECKAPHLLKTFPSYGIADRKIYKNWILTEIERDKPTTIIPCHGSIVRNAKLPALLVELVGTI